MVVLIRMGVEIPTSLGTNILLAVPKLICPANLLPVKGHKYLIEAIKILKDMGIQISLEIAGSGQLEHELKAQTTSLGLDDYIHFAGQIPHNMLLQRYATGEISAVVLSSVDLGNNVREGVPVCLIEALAYGIPTIATNIGAIPELLSDGAGYLVPDKDAPSTRTSDPQIHDGSRKQ